jgi:hypothetical protein
MLGHGADLALGTAGRDDHVVGDARFAAQIDHDDFLGLVVVERGDDEIGQSVGVE